MVKEEGGGSNYLCLSESPVFMENEAGIEDGARARVYGVEYTKTFGMSNDEAPCAVCQSRRKASLMIPATNQCLSGWTTEYAGFLVASNAVNQKRTEFVCLDGHFEHTLHSDSSDNKAEGKASRFVQAEAKCGALPCRPYINNADLLCVVCSR